MQGWRYVPAAPIPPFASSEVEMPLDLALR